MSWLCNIFGYLLNFIYTLVKNYGLALIIFSIITKIIMLPLSIKQQKTLKKSAKIQDKYSKDQERLTQETMNLYKRENMNPLSGCLSSIVQIVLLFAMFFLVREPLTYMLKLSPDQISKYENMISAKSAYSQIEVIKEARTNNEIDIDLNMDFCGIDMCNVLMQNWQNWTVYIIPALYIISSIISTKMNSNVGKSKKQNDIKNNEKENEDPMAQMNKNMTIMMPIMSVSIAIVVPQGLALYWLMNNILMIVEKLILNKVLKDEEEE